MEWLDLGAQKRLRQSLSNPVYKYQDNCETQFSESRLERNFELWRSLFRILDTFAFYLVPSHEVVFSLH